MFSAGQYAAWLLTVAASAIVAVRLGWRPPGVLRILQGYLLAQAGYAAALMPLSFASRPRLYYVGFAIASLTDYSIHFSLLAAIARGLKGRHSEFGRLRYWALACLVLATIVAAGGLLTPPYGGRPGLWTEIDQILSICRVLAIIGVGLYAWVQATAWPRRLLLVWIGLAVQCGSDFIVTRFLLVAGFSAYGLLQYLPIMGFLTALCLWWQLRKRSNEVSDQISIGAHI